MLIGLKLINDPELILGLQQSDDVGLALIGGGGIETSGTPSTTSPGSMNVDHIINFCSDPTTITKPPAPRRINTIIVAKCSNPSTTTRPIKRRAPSRGRRR